MTESQVAGRGGLHSVPWLCAETAVPGVWLEGQRAGWQLTVTRRVSMIFPVLLLRVGNRARVIRRQVLPSVTGCMVLDCAATRYAS